MGQAKQRGTFEQRKSEAISNSLSHLAFKPLVGDWKLQSSMDGIVHLRDYLNEAGVVVRSAFSIDTDEMDFTVGVGRVGRNAEASELAESLTQFGAFDFESLGSINEGEIHFNVYSLNVSDPEMLKIYEIMGEMILTNKEPPEKMIIAAQEALIQKRCEQIYHAKI